MQTVFSQRLLAGLQARTSEEEDRDDPDDRVDPDDSGPRLSFTLKDDAEGVVTNIRNSRRVCYPELPPPPVGATAAAAGTPPPPDLLDPVVLRTMPPKVAAFMLYEPREPPPWRRQETLEERAHRVQLEDCGSWVGE